MRKSLTLIELLISIVLLSIIVFALSGIVGNLKKTREILHSSVNSQTRKNTAMKVLYYDMLNARSINLFQTKNYTLVKLQTSNSLHDMAEPYVVWYVSKNKKTLMRMETPEKHAFLSEARNYYLDKFAQNVKIFKIYRYFYKYFVYIDDGKPIYFEMYKGF